MHSSIVRNEFVHEELTQSAHLLLSYAFFIIEFCEDNGNIRVHMKKYQHYSFVDVSILINTCCQDEVELERALSLK